MLDWMLMPLRKYAQFSGRSRRREYWSFVLLLIIVYLVLMLVALSLGWAPPAVGDDPTNVLRIYASFLDGAGLLILVSWLSVLIPQIAVTVRRLHDRNMTGWWYLGFFIALFIPVINIIAVIALLVLMLLPGDTEPNKYGPDPKEMASPEVFA